CDAALPRCPARPCATRLSRRALGARPYSAKFPPAVTRPPLCIPFEELCLSDERFDGFIFDCDGTLADTMPLHHRAWLFALGQAGARFEFDWELFVSRAGMSLENTVVELNRQFGERLDPVEVAAAQRAY